MKRLIAIAALLALPAVSGAADIAEILEGITNPQIVVGAAYLQQAPVAGGSRYSVLLTANILGPKMGSFPCYIGGVGLDIRALDPAFENTAGVGYSIPYITCNPWSEEVVIQVGQASDFTAMPELGASRSYYVGVGISWNSPAQLKVKRVARAKAKEHAALLKLQDEAQRIARAQ